MALCNLVKALSLASCAVPALCAVHHQWTEPPKGWVATDSRPVDSTTMSLTIALNTQNMDQLESKLLAVSTPGSVDYGKHLDRDAAASLFAPSSEAVSKVKGWLDASGVTAYRVDGAFVDFAADLATVEAMLGAKYQYYAKDGVTKLRTLEYSVPDHVQNHVALVEPTTYFGNAMPLSTQEDHPKMRPRSDAVTTSSGGDSTPGCTGNAMYPECLKDLYKIGNYTPDASSGSKIGFANFLNQSTILTDLYLWQKEFGIPQQNFSVQLINGAQNPQKTTNDNLDEANMDVQVIMGVSHPLPVINYITGGSPPFIPNIDHPTQQENFNEPWVPYFRYLLSQNNSDLPQVVAQSYGDLEYSVPLDYAKLSCQLMGQLSLRGISVMFMSGNWGVGSGCLSPDDHSVEFNAVFPATCPYVTTVGGTVSLSPEMAYEGSSGGFSRYFPRPSYQDAAVAAYMKTVDANTQAYYGPYTNFSGRGFPDVAAHSYKPDYPVVENGKWFQNGGTSASVHVWAAIVALLNDARFKAGKTSALGWLNPLLYAHGADLLTDITQGFSIGCNGKNTQSGGAEPAGSGLVPGARWNATVGWDTTTGLGTPNFERLRQFVLTI